MFSGIIEAVEPIIKSESLQNAVRIAIRRPTFFDDIKNGDSIAVDGVCLTVETFDSEQIIFTVAAESLKVLQWDTQNNWLGRSMNLERSLRFGDRIHGHLVTGHVDSLGKVIRTEAQGDSWFIDVEIHPSLAIYVWKKGSITLNGVSLTVNEFKNSVVSVCLIPETVQRTNLTHKKINEYLNIEPDYFAKAVMNGVEKWNLIPSKNS